MKILSLSFLVLLSLFVQAQIVDHLFPTATGDSVLHFPILEPTGIKDQSERANLDISLEMLGFDVLDPYADKVGKDTYISLKALDYEAELVSDQLYLITFSAEGCGAYCSNYNKHIVYDLQQKEQVQLADMFTQAGQDSLRRFLEFSKRAQLNKWFQTKHTENLSAQELETQQQIYSRCFKFTRFRNTPIYLFDFTIKESSVIIYTDACAEHAERALDDIGQFEHEIKLSEWKAYLTAYGKRLLDN